MIGRISRLDGRSNTQVVIDYVRTGEPGRIYTYDELAAALAVGTTHNYGRAEIAAIVGGAQVRMLRELQRTLFNVRGQGYRLSHANDHNRLALVRTRRADVQMRRGFQTLQNVRWDEMEPEARKVHEGTLMIVGSMYQQQRAMDQRISAVEDAIRGLRKDAESGK